jgi:GNAT superfamily N-acetyltransferase
MADTRAGPAANPGPRRHESRTPVLRITPATHEDAATIVALLEELNRFYGTTQFDPTELRVRQIESLLFRACPAAHLLLARDDTQAVGLAAYTFMWPAVGVTQSLYLKELYVGQQHRKRGIGRALMRNLCEIALTNECSRLEWTTDRANPDAMRFYDALGVPVNPTKVFYRVEGTDLAALQRRV